MFISEFVSFVELLWQNLTAVALTIFLGGSLAGILHLWTRRHHDTHKAPNWTLLQMCNCLCVALFVLSTVQLFQRTAPGSKAHLGWAFMCLLCITYFFSIFGVWFVHSLLLDDDMLHDNAVKLYSDCDAAGNGRESPSSSTSSSAGASHSPTLGPPGQQRRGGVGSSGRGGFRDPAGRQHVSSGGELGGGGGGDRGGRSSSPTTAAAVIGTPAAHHRHSPTGSPQHPSTSPREALRDLRSANDRLGRARNDAEAWGLSGMLWRLTYSGSVTVDMLRETRIGRTTGLYCRRTCGRCGLQTCDWCQLMAAWKQMAWNDIGGGGSGSPAGGGGSGGGGHNGGGAGPASGGDGHHGGSSSGGGHHPGGGGGSRNGSPSKQGGRGGGGGGGGGGGSGGGRGSRHSPTSSMLLRNGYPSMPAIPELRERTESSESSNSEMDVALSAGAAAMATSVVSSSGGSSGSSSSSSSSSSKAPVVPPPPAPSASSSSLPLPPASPPRSKSTGDLRRRA